MMALYILFLLIKLCDMHTLDACPLQQVQTVGEAVEVIEYNTPDAGLDYELGTFDTWGGCDIERGAFARIVALGHFGYGICLGVEYIRLGQSMLILADVLKPGGCPVEAVGDYHLVFYNQCSDLTAAAIGVLGPYLCHAEVTLVKQRLLIFVIHLL